MNERAIPGTLAKGHMMRRWGVGAAIAACVVSLLSGCTGGQEGSAAETVLPQKNTPVVPAKAAASPPQAPPAVDPAKDLKAISPVIPVYAGARYRDDLTRRDSIMIRSQYGPNAQVYTLATDDSFPQVWHYYVTYLAQFRAYPRQSPYPPEKQTWRSMEVQLNQAMQDPFIPGDTLALGERQVTLQLAETEAEPRTVIRYIVTPQPAAGTPTVAGGQ
jgi:hypothetical protein